MTNCQTVNYTNNMADEKVDFRKSTLETEQLKDQISLLVLTSTTAKEIIKITGISDQYCRTMIRTAKEEIKNLGLVELKALINTKFRQSFAHHALVAKALASEFMLTQREIESIRSLQATHSSDSIPDESKRSDQGSNISSKHLEQHVNKLIKLGKHLTDNDKNLADIINKMGVHPNTEKTPDPRDPEGSKIGDFVDTSTKAGVLVELRNSSRRIMGYVRDMEKEMKIESIPETESEIVGG